MPLLFATGGGRIFSTVPVTVSGVQSVIASQLVCQAFADAGGGRPAARGFRSEEEMVLGGILQTVGAVGCAMLGGSGGFGRIVGLVGS